MSRVALVIGNAAYPHAALPNARGDAEAVGAALTRLGFQVTVERDLRRLALEAALARFAVVSRGAEAAACFYAGHAFQVAGSVYLVPVDWARGRSDGLVPMGRLLGAMVGAKARVVLLDACRNNPLRDTGALGRATAPIGALGSTVLYATRAGGSADDGLGAHSPFAESLLRHIETPGLEIVDLYRAIAADLHGIQTPELWLSQAEPFRFAP